MKSRFIPIIGPLWALGQASYQVVLADAAVADFAVVATHEPGDGPFDHRAVLPVAPARRSVFCNKLLSDSSPGTPWI
jgi:hypothetical protein